ncbi:MAG: anthranilate synthase component I, partial [Pseudomonadota bacterium]|nr:anthranilate synthase component I [Pseudomonadota bacterium]
KNEEPALESLQKLIEDSRIQLPENLPPMAAGLVGYLGYNTVSLMEAIPSSKPDPIGTPDGLFIRPKIMAIFDLVKDTMTIVTPVRPVPDKSAEQAWELAEDRLLKSVKNFGRPLDRQISKAPKKSPSLKLHSNTSKENFIKMVAKAKDYILAGDIFQVVLSQRFKIPFKLPPFALYRSLRRTNPSPFLYYLNFENFSVVGSSPEILVRMRDGKVTIRPLAGTRKRGATQAEDQKLEKELLGDQKELAEHLMLLDLGRNDVGRVAKIGTVKVTEKMIIERYSHVMHISSNVEGEIDSNRGAMEALAAGFPAGTVSGAPKIRAMEIIDELEVEKRGIYAGTVGYFSANGSMDTCILLRTAILKDGNMYVQAGAGVVSDSVAEAEYQECQNKAAALIRSAEEAHRYISE